MIKLKGMNNKEFYLNSEHIEKIEEVPDTVVTLSNGKKYIVLETAEEIIDKIIEFKNKIFIFSKQEDV